VSGVDDLPGLVLVRRQWLFAQSGDGSGHDIQEYRCASGNIVVLQAESPRDEGVKQDSPNEVIGLIL
jgi:hypothetical protein